MNVQDDVTRTAGLEKSLQLCTGLKVMLKRNKDVEAGLVNGSVGTVSGFVGNADKIHAIQVKFDHIDKSVTVERESYSFQILKGIFYTRKQFPIMLAFAITIHKSQGLSLQSAIIDAGKSCFGSGMVYVALSRVTSLAGLHLTDLDKSRIKCDKKAISEYNRLRQKYTPHLGKMVLTEECIKRKQEHTTDQPATKRPTNAQPSEPTASVLEHVDIHSLTEMTQS